MDDIIAQLDELNENMSKVIAKDFAKSLKEDEKINLIQEMLSSLERSSELQEQMYYQVSNIEERLANIENEISRKNNQEEK